jgi:hypothetical protein
MPPDEEIDSYADDDQSDQDGDRCCDDRPNAE